jgi:transposase-like protein
MAKRTFGREFKLQVVRQLVHGDKRMAQICREYGLCQTLVRRWREQYETAGENAWLEQRELTAGTLDATQRIAALEAALGRAHLEIDFLRHSLEVLRKGGSRPTNNGH